MDADATLAPPPDRASLAGALRELEAAKARVERDARTVYDDTKKKLVSELLPVLDNLDRTIKAAKDNGDAPAIVEGIELVRSQLEGVLRGYGVERIDALAQPFDPAIHEAVTTLAVLTPQAHNLVIDQLAAGYRYGGALLRPAKVVVGRMSRPEYARNPYGLG
jgi:molecular chaperone GrpE